VDLQSGGLISYDNQIKKSIKSTENMMSMTVMLV
jgi:hypothetical protein